VDDSGGVGPNGDSDRAEARRRAAGKALAVATERFKRMMIRGLDYLPPGDVSFADFGRAMLAADQAAHATSNAQREWLCDEFVRRGVVRSIEELAVRTNFTLPTLAAIDMDELVFSDWVAYQFVSDHLALFGIPPRTPFVVRPRLDVRKLYYTGNARREVRECLLKVSWSETEPNAQGDGFPDRRQVTMGATLAIDWKRPVVRALLFTDREPARREDRDALVKRLFDEGGVRIGSHADAPDGGPLAGVVRAEKVNGALRLRGTARMLHLTREA